MKNALLLLLIAVLVTFAESKQKAAPNKKKTEKTDKKTEETTTEEDNKKDDNTTKSSNETVNDDVSSILNFWKSPFENKPVDPYETPLEAAIKPLFSVDEQKAGYNGLVGWLDPKPRSFAEYLCRLNRLELLTSEEAVKRFEDIVDLFQIRGYQGLVEIWIKGNPCQERRWVSRSGIFGFRHFIEAEEKACRGLAMLQRGQNTTFRTTKLPCADTAYIVCF